jgi:hypothetical protein
LTRSRSATAGPPSFSFSGRYIMEVIPLVAGALSNVLRQRS